MSTGRTARIGNTGLATSFYNDRDEGMADFMVKILLENNQPIPDFFQSLIPEDAKVEFNDNSDDESDDGGDAGGDEGGWGNGGDAAADNGAPAAEAEAWGSNGGNDGGNSGAW